MAGRQVKEVAGVGGESTVLEETIDANYEPTEEEIAEYAKWLGMDLDADKHLFWVAREGLKAPLPPEWKPCQSPEGELYYFNFQSGESVWDHPCDDHYRGMFQVEKKKNPKPAPDAKEKGKKKRPKASGSSSGSISSASTLSAVVAPKDRSNLASAADLLGPVSVGSAQPASAGLGRISGGIPMETNKGVLGTPAPLGGAKQAAASGGAAAAGAEVSEADLMEEFEQWEMDQKQKHEQAKAALKQRIAAKTNDEEIRELNKQVGSEITAMKLEQDKLRREKSDIETRSPVVKAGGGMDELERSRQQMAVENEKVTLGAKLTAAEYEERNKAMVKEKQAVENAAVEADTELKQELAAVQAQHDADIQQAKSGFEQAQQRADLAGQKVGQLAQQKESTMLLKETERYTAELSKKLQTARAAAEFEIESKLAEAKAAQDEKATERIKAERVKLDAEREKLLVETREMMELKKTKLLREVGEEIKEGGGSAGAGKDVAAVEVAKARKEFELEATKKKSTLQDKLDQARTEARQGLPAAELKLKTQLSDELDELENDFRTQLEKERSDASAGEDISDDVDVASLPAAKEAELRAWKEEQESDASKGIAIEVAELKAQNTRELKKTDGEAKANTARVEAKTSSLAKELEAEKKRLTDSTARSVSAARTMAQEADTREINSLRLRMQSESNTRLSELSTELQRESATAGATIEKERARVEAELESTRVERLASLNRVKVALTELEISAAASQSDLATAQTAQAKLKAELASAPWVVDTAVSAAPASGGLQAAALQEAETRLLTTQTELRSALADKRAQYERDEATLQDELKRSMSAKPAAAAAPASSTGDSTAELERKYAMQREQYEAQVVAELSQVRAAERQTQESAEASMATEFTALEQRLQAAMSSGGPSPAGSEVEAARAAANAVAQELASVEQEERMLAARIEAEKVQLSQEQALVAQLEQQAIANAALRAPAAAAQPAKEAWGEAEPASASLPLGPSDANRQPAVSPAPAEKPASAPAQQTWAEPVARELAPAAASHSEPEAGRFDSERKKLENAKKAASTASRALQVRQQQWEARRDEWLADMRVAKSSGQPEASEFLRGVKSTLDDQANALNVEAKKLNKKKKQIRQMTQQLRAMDAEAQADDDDDDGAVSTALRSIDADLHQVRRSIESRRQQSGGGSKQSARAQTDEALVDLQRKWA